MQVSVFFFIFDSFAGFSFCEYCYSQIKCFTDHFGKILYCFIDDIVSNNLKLLPLIQVWEVFLLMVKF